MPNTWLGSDKYQFRFFYFIFIFTQPGRSESPNLLKRKTDALLIRPSRPVGVYCVWGVGVYGVNCKVWCVGVNVWV